MTYEAKWAGGESEGGARDQGPSRRAVLASAVGVVASLALPLQAQAIDDERTTQFQTAYHKLVGEKEPPDGPIKLELPDLAENGNMVPFTFSLESPMTAEAYVKTLTAFSTGNPHPVIATFHFTPSSGRASISGRLRLARTQDIVVVAELNTGERMKATANVKVTVGGCGSG